MNIPPIDMNIFPTSFTVTAPGLGLGGATARLVTIRKLNPTNFNEDKWVIEPFASLPEHTLFLTTERKWHSPSIAWWNSEAPPAEARSFEFTLAEAVRIARRSS